MRAVVQRVENANVRVKNKVVGEIKDGLLILLAIHKDDQEIQIEKMVDKIIKMRIFSDEQGKMNLSLLDKGGEILVVSQFTLYADARKGNRPSFVDSAPPEKAKEYYEKFVILLREKGIKVETGSFREMMKVGFVNIGPTTIILDI